MHTAGKKTFKTNKVVVAHIRCFLQGFDALCYCIFNQCVCVCVRIVCVCVWISIPYAHNLNMGRVFVLVSSVPVFFLPGMTSKRNFPPSSLLVGCSVTLFPDKKMDPCGQIKNRPISEDLRSLNVVFFSLPSCATAALLSSILTFSVWMMERSIMERTTISLPQLTCVTLKARYVSALNSGSISTSLEFSFL